MFSTYLYVKRHTITGKCYFGKTIRDPLKYLGSGLHWSRHIKQHGKQHVETLWYKHFTDRTECVAEAIKFSEDNNIVKSDLWLNMRIENGLDGGGRDGSTHSAETKAKMAKSHFGKIQSKETIAKRAIQLRGRILSADHKVKIAIARQGLSLSSDTKRKISESLKGSVHSDEAKAKMSEANLAKRQCPHCGMLGGSANMSRYHFEKCKAARR
jgi:hypothetical protein